MTKHSPNSTKPPAPKPSSPVQTTDPYITLAVAPNWSARAKNVTGPWSELCDRLMKHVQRGTHADLATKTTLDRVKNGPCFLLGPVCDETAGKTVMNMAAITMLTIDLDDVTPATYDAVCTQLSPYEYVVYSTHRHDPKTGTARLRICLPLANELPLQRFADAWNQLQAFIGGHNDPVTKNSNRLNYFPSTFDLEVAFAQRHRGVFLNVDELPPVAAPTHTPPPKTSNGSPSDDQATAMLRYKAYLQKVPSAVEGDGGDHATYKAACAGRDFGLTEDNTFEALEEWNAGCVPPWERDDLRSKVEHAYRYATGEAGAKLNNDGFEPWTDSGNAERMARMFNDTLRYAEGLGWLAWDGYRFQTNAESQAQLCAKKTARSLREEAKRLGENAPKGLAEHGKSSESRQRRSAMVDLAKHEPRLRTRADALDADPFLFNVANGTIDLRSRALMPHSQANLLTKKSEVRFDATATAPRWKAFLNQVMNGNAALIAFLQRAVGYSLTGNVSEQVLFFCHGSGANGKTTFTNTLMKLGGDYASSAAPNLLMAKHGESHPTELADLQGARIVVAQEVEQNRAMSEALVKQLTGGDKIKARRMRQDFYEFSPQHKLWLCANHKPGVRGNDHAIWRRILLVPFTVTIPQAQRDKTLGDKLDAELPGILNWALDGVSSWLSGELQAPSEVLAATEAYRDEMDLVGDFMDERCIVESSASVSASALYEAFNLWCSARGEKRSQRFLGSDLANRAGLHRAKDGQGCIVWRGLRLRSQGFGLTEGTEGLNTSRASKDVSLSTSASPKTSSNPPSPLRPIVEFDEL